jgi:hypothetical protein
MTLPWLNLEPREIRPIELLYLNYTGLRNAWAAHLLNRSRDLSAPGFEWKRGAEDEPISARTELLQAGELIAINAGKCVLHYLRTLSKAYTPNRNSDGSLASHDWPSTAAFCLGRGILEAAATVIWLMDPALTSDERLRRSARIALWSARQDRRESLPRTRTFDGWKAVAVKAGLQVNDKDRWRIKVGHEGNLEAFSHTNTIRAVFGQAGTDFYGFWSGVAHQAAWALAEWSTVEIQPEGDGALAYTDQGEADHLDLASNIADLLGMAGAAISAYWGRDDAAFAMVASAVAVETAEAASQLRNT